MESETEVYCGLHMILGEAYQQQGRWIEAREAFRTVVRPSSDESSARAARRAIAWINEMIGED